MSVLSLDLPLTQSTLRWALCQGLHLPLASIRPTKSSPQETLGCSSEKANEVHTHLRKSSAS